MLDPDSDPDPHSINADPKPWFFSRPIQWYHSLADPIWPDGTFKMNFQIAYPTFMKGTPRRRTKVTSFSNEITTVQIGNRVAVRVGRLYSDLPHPFLQQVLHKDLKTT